MDGEIKRSESSRRALGECRRGFGTSYLRICKGEFIYVDESHYLQLWDRIFVPCALRMRSDKFCVKTF